VTGYATTVDRRLPIVDAVAPPTRLAAYRILFSAFVAIYLLVRLPHFLVLGDRADADFAPVGLLSVLDRPPAGWAVDLAVLGTILASLAACAGWRYRIAGPVMAVGMLLLATLHSSWGQLLHFEHLMVLHALVMGFAPAADAWSLDARRHCPARNEANEADEAPTSTRYGWPIAMLVVITVITYVVAGIAKLRYGGIDWLTSDTLRNHIAYTATRAELLGGDPAPLAGLAIRTSWLLAPFAVATVLLELGAPIAMLGGRWRDVWVIAVWGMHVGIALTMWIGFPLVLWGIAFAPMFAIEDVGRRLVTRATPYIARLPFVAALRGGSSSARRL